MKRIKMRMPDGGTMLVDVQDDYEEESSSIRDLPHAIYEFFTMWGRGMMNNDKDNPTAEIMGGEEGGRS
jgi:hypothetical protein